jgi:hypothetical protein
VVECVRNLLHDLPLLIQAVDLVDTTIRIGNSSTSHRWGFTYAASASSRIAKKQDPSLGEEIVRVILGAKNIDAMVSAMATFPIILEIV